MNWEVRVDQEVQTNSKRPLWSLTKNSLPNPACWTSIGVFVFTLLLQSGCTKPTPDPNLVRKARAEGALTGGTLVFSDDFNRAELGAQWTAQSNAWRIVAGQVIVSGAKNDGLWWNGELPEHTRVEFEARSDSAEGDLKFEIFAARQEHQAGYVGIFGGWSNRISVIARLDEHGEDRLEDRSRKVEQGRIYRFAVVRIAGSFEWFIDGELFMSFDDPQPLPGRRFGFNDWMAPVRFDNFKVFDVSAAAAR